MENSNILIIDDDQVMAHGLSKRLVKRNYLVDVEYSGEEILAKLEANSYDLILLDIKMPKISGPDVLLLIREKYHQNLLPIIMFSSCDESTDIVNALNLGANDYVTKPVNFCVLLSRIQTHLQIKKLSLDFAKNEQLEAVSAMITTYNHEINNSLTISMGKLCKAKREKTISPELFQELVITQEKITKIVKKINHISEEKCLNFSKYGSNSKMVNLS